MRTLNRLVVGLGLVALITVGCGSEDTATADAGAAQTDGGGTGGAGDAGGAQDAGASTGGETVALPNTCAVDGDCKTGSCVAQVCIITPNEAVLLTDNHTDTNVAEAPNLGCVDAAHDTSAGPETVTLYGIVDRFGGGRKTVGIEVSIFLAKDWPPAECLAKTGDAQSECFRTIEPAKAEWKVVSTDPSAGNPQNPGTCEEHLDCAPGYECIEGRLDFSCLDQFGLYEIPNVPTNTVLVLRARNAPTQSIFDSKWHDTYSLGVYVHADKVDSDGRYRANALMVSDSQWKTIPNTLGVPGGIKKGNSAVGGRIRDCRGSDRDSFTVGNATVGLANPASAIGYFNNDEDDTVPIAERTATDIFGRFAMVNVPAGPNRVAAAALIDGKVTSLGAEDMFVVPNALVVVAFPGKQPILTK